MLPSNWTSPKWCLLVLLGGIPATAQERDTPQAVRPGAESKLVRVNIATESLGDGETVILNGRKVTDYRPRIIQLFPSTGVVIDGKGHVLTFLGYRWVDVQGRRRRIEIVNGAGRKLPGKLVGIDESTGVAVVQCQEGGLETTPLCLTCEVRNGATVVTTVPEEGRISQLQSAKVLSVGTSQERPGGRWEVTVNQRLPVLGEPLLDSEHRVLGFIAGQKPSPQDPAGMQTVVYPMSQLITSAEKIIAAGGDIRTGWLGVYLDDDHPAPKGGVRVRSVLNDSPAHKAGLAAEDIVLDWSGTRIRDSLQFIRLVQNTGVGSKVALQVLRKGKPVSLTAVIGHRKPEGNKGAIIVKFPEEITIPGSVTQGEITYLRYLPQQDHPRLGIEIVGLTPKLAEFLQVPVQTGLLVSNVEDEMPGALGGIQIGDVILSVDDRPVTDPPSFSDHVRERGWGSTVLLKINRKGRTQELEIQLPAEQPASAGKGAKP